MKRVVVTVLLLATVVCYARVVGFDFIALDDPGYVTTNVRLAEGLSWDNTRWAFTTGRQANWHPLTWLSLMLDAELGGIRPPLFHLTNLLLHLLATLVLYGVFQRMNAAPWRNAFVAAVFALHPLHVESVAWVSERKDVLSGLFWMLTLWAWVRYAERPTPSRYSTVVVLFAMGLMAKPMLVTLPLVLLLLDYWPLGRMTGKRRDLFTRWGPLWDKLPLGLLALASAVITIYVQAAGGATSTLERLPLGTRTANALIAYVAYIGKALWPQALALPYPYRLEVLTPLRVSAAALLLAAITIAAVVSARRRPYLLVGWLWYVITLLPVIGLVQVGSQAMADRYTYVPLIGLSIIVAWGLPHHRAVAAVVLGVVLALAVRCYVQVGYWRDTVTLFSHGVAVTRDNATAHNVLGLGLAATGRNDEALAHYRQAVAILPSHIDANVNLGAALARNGLTDDAIARYEIALRQAPDDPTILGNLAAAYIAQGRMKEAAIRLSRALVADPENALNHRRLATILALEGDDDEAMRHFRTALETDPGETEARIGLATVLMTRGDLAGAEEQFLEVLRRSPDLPAAHKNLGVVYARQGRFTDAVRHFTDALRLAPGDEGIRRNLERARRMAGADDTQESP